MVELSRLFLRDKSWRISNSLFPKLKANGSKLSIITYYRKRASDIFTCAEHLISGVNLRISFLRSANDFVTIAEDDAKHYRAEIVRANLYVKKMAITDKMVSVIEKTLLKSPAIYKYTEVIPKTFLIATGQRSWKHEDIFTKEPIRRMMIAMNTNAAFVGSNNTNPFHYQKFDLSEVVVYRNGIPIVGTPVTNS